MEDFISTRVSKLKKDAGQEFVSVSYEGPKKKSRGLVRGNEVQNSTDNSKQDTYIDRRRKQELEMKRVRYEVMKFGMTGFEKVQAEKAKVALAISLGAKRPKNKGVNYKTLKELRKMEKITQEKNQEHVSGLEKSLMKHKTKKPHKTKKLHKKDSGGILDVYGKVSKKPPGKSHK